jgi:dihydroxyacetone kinase-like protein
MTEGLIVRWVRLAAPRVREARGRLTELDAAIGDGDHGINLDRGLAELERRLASGEIPEHPPAATLEAAGRTIMATVGGASGALYGRALLGAAAALAASGDGRTSPASGDGRTGPASGDPPATREERAAAAVSAAVHAVALLGRATTGEKTMLDALVPARDALAAAVAEGEGLAAAAGRAAAAAEAGAAATTPLLATKGRASYLGERSIGHLDPGAVSSAILLRALADAALED